METPKEILHEIDNANNYYLEDREMLVVPLETIKQYFESIPVEPEVDVQTAIEVTLLLHGMDLTPQCDRQGR